MKASKRKASLVIFDKDGTLICFHSTWVPWAKDTAKRITELAKMDLTNDVYDVLGYSSEQERVHLGLLASATMGQIRNALAHLLISKGFDSADALNIVSSAILYSDERSQRTEKQIYDLRHLFETLHERDVKVALCTSDSRKRTIELLKRLNVEHLVDVVVCGDDAGTMPKPHPHNALSICRQLNVDPMDALVVGDTLADLGMGRSANLGGTIGVLSGICNQEELRPLADYVVITFNRILIKVSDVGNILPIVENMRRPCTL
uniref:Phosphoglycolate phosphatase n=1 Tax=Syphacia muris TaxID=451379 RepID=A0A0N5AKX0_9BILA